jgi:hypothetical protein
VVARPKPQLFPYALVTTDGDALGPVVFAEELEPGDVIPLGPGRAMRVVNVIPADHDDEYPLLYVELANSADDRA